MILSRVSLLLLGFAIAITAPDASASELPLLPQPAKVIRGAGAFGLDAHTPIIVSPDDRAARQAAERFVDLLERVRGTRLQIVTGERPKAIRFASATGFAPEAYRIVARGDRIDVSAKDPAGLFYGAVTLWQLATGDTPGVIPEVTIEDAPRYSWRGFMLDSARHFQSPAFIKKLIDWMAVNKLNRLHWHLVDDQGWRIEIPKYPRLTQISAWRIPATAPGAPSLPATGGFYTQAEIRDIVAYAEARAIVVVPEIEMPGHATAAIRAYPSLGMGVPLPDGVWSDWGVYPWLYNTDDATFAFLEGVLDDVMDLFPSPWIHIGGDEAVKDQWRASPAIQAQMKALGLADEDALQGWFTARIGAYLAKRNRRLLGWDEILAGGIPANATVMSWRGTDGAITAAKAGHDAILSPAPTLYFDHRQSDGADEPPGRGKVVSLADVYAFEPEPAALDADQHRHILGLQGNLWTEHVRTEARTAWMAFPRAIAVAERGWSPAGTRNYGNFLDRLRPQLKRMQPLGLAAATSAFTAPVQPDPAALRRTSRELQTCRGELVLHLEDDFPAQGPRARFLTDIMNPCWLWRDAPLQNAGRIALSVGQIPFNFQIGKDVEKIRFRPPATPAGEFEVRAGGCDGRLIATLPLAPAAANPGVTTLHNRIAPQSGKADLCITYTARGVHPIWALDAAELKR